MNRYRLTCMVTAICYFLNFISAQIDFRQFPLDSFRLPDIDRKALDVSGSFSSRYTDVHSDLEFFDTHSYNISPRFNINYFRYINRQNLQAQWTIHADEDFSISYEDSPSTEEPLFRVHSDPDLNFNGTMRKYRDNSFLEYGMNFNISHTYEYLKESQALREARSKNLTFRTGIAPTIGFGKGRLEPISDVSMAMFILKDAIELGVDGSGISTNDIYKFAQLMADVRNRRIFDNRILRIQELRDLYSFMLDKGWTRPEDPGFFTVLTDNWYSNDRFLRESGRRWRYLLTPELNYLSRILKEDFFQTSRSESLSFQVTGLVEFRREKPISLFKDNWRIHRLSTSVFNHNIIDNTFLQPNTFLNVNFENGIGKDFYPNNRTFITTSLNGIYSFYKSLSGDNPTKDQHVISAELQGDCSYFLSYRSRITANILFQYTQNTGGQSLVPIVAGISTNGKSNGFHARLGASLIVSLF